MSELSVHRDPDLTPAQEKIGKLSREFREVLAAHGYPSTEAHARVTDFKAAVLELMWEELKPTEHHTPRDLKGWWRYGKRMAWLSGYDKAIDKVWRAMMRQESWARILRKPNRTVEGD